MNYFSRIPGRCTAALNCLLLQTAMVTSLVGCGSSEKDFLPSATAARTALDSSLNAWKSGAPIATITTGLVPIDTYDARWRDGQKLESFEVVSEQSVDERPTFSVKIKLADDKEVIDDTFVVVGNNPLMVFRQQDYDKAGGAGGATE